MKKEWKTPEISCLDVKQTEAMWGGEGTDLASYSVTDINGTVIDVIYGTSTGSQTFVDHVITTYT